MTLVRLATALNVEFPFEAYEEVHELPVIEVEFSHLTGMDDSHGTLTLLDTGPNEAGQPQLQAMMRDQLQKASAVLAVLDYTQLNSEADQQVRAELNDIANVAAGRLFVPSINSTSKIVTAITLRRSSRACPPCLNMTS